MKRSPAFVFRATSLRAAGAERQRGFTLIEILVGLAIALIGTVAIFQAVAAWDARKRTTVAGTDAQISGSVGLYALERDLKLAGYGYSAFASGTTNTTFLGCQAAAYDNKRPTPTFALGMYPILITDGASGAPDTIQVLWGNSAQFAASQVFTGSTATTKKLQSRGGILKGDLILIAQNSPSAQCALAQVTDNTNSDGVTISHDNASYYDDYKKISITAEFNPSGGPNVASPFATGWIYDLGPSPALNRWQITGGRTLTVTNDLSVTSGSVDVAEGIINLQAQYGTDANGNGMVDSGEWNTTIPANWSQLLAVRVALLARSQEYEKTAVTPNAPTWGGGQQFAMTNVDGTPDTNPNDPNDWRHYRYRVYETVIPLRNVIWGTMQ